jgi:ubiquinone/menaquinone biosynthesis C-methylase UbiE
VGIWSIPESEARMLPDNLTGKDAIELGYGTAYIATWMHRRGARVVGIDNSEKQLEMARRLQRVHGLGFTLLRGNAETVPIPPRASISLSRNMAQPCGRTRSD